MDELLHQYPGIAMLFGFACGGLFGMGLYATINDLVRRWLSNED